jgi:hypothetical protein
MFSVLDAVVRRQAANVLDCGKTVELDHDGLAVADLPQR